MQACAACLLSHALIALLMAPASAGMILLVSQTGIDVAQLHPAMSDLVCLRCSQELARELSGDGMLWLGALHFAKGRMLWLGALHFAKGLMLQARQQP